MTAYLCVSWNLNIQKNDPNVHITHPRKDVGLFRIMVLDYSNLHCAFFKPELQDWFWDVAEQDKPQISVSKYIISYYKDNVLQGRRLFSFCV